MINATDSAATRQSPNVVAGLDLPYEQDWLWFGDLNIIGLSSRLDEAGRRRALDEALSAA